MTTIHFDSLDTQIKLQHNLGEDLIDRLKDEVSQIEDELRNAGVAAQTRESALKGVVADIQRSMNNAARRNQDAETAIAAIEAITDEIIDSVTTGDLAARVDTLIASGRMDVARRSFGGEPLAPDAKPKVIELITENATKPKLKAGKDETMNAGPEKGTNNKTRKKVGKGKKHKAPKKISKLLESIQTVFDNQAEKISHLQKKLHNDKTEITHLLQHQKTENQQSPYDGFKGSPVFFLERKDKELYEQYREFVIVAKDEQEARKLAHEETNTYDLPDGDTYWLNAADICKKIAPCSNEEDGIVSYNFNNA